MSINEYARPSITTDIVLLRVMEIETAISRKKSDKYLQVLLIKRDIEPQKGKWSLPGGFLNIDERLDSNIKRKLKEKTGISGDFYMEQLFTFDEITRDERGRVISTSYYGLVNSETYKNSGGTAEQRWVNIDEALRMNLAFDHNKIIECAMERLRGKIEWTDVAFNLLPSEFAINDCRDVYELIWGHKVDNFRRRIEKYVEPTGKMRTGKQFRPAELYKWKRMVINIKERN
jgi:8-oxo-dGTP diphosphatase